MEDCVKVMGKIKSSIKLKDMELHQKFQNEFGSE